MKRLLGILFGLVGTIVLLLVAAAVVLPLIFDENDLKLAIAREVREQTGRDLVLAGDLDFSVFPWLAVEVSDLSLSNAPGFGDRPFARIGEARAGVALVPLLRRQISVDRITLHGLELALAVDEGGRNNWDDLAAEEEGGPGEDAGPGTFSSRRVAGLDIRDGSVDFNDRQAGSHYLLTGLSLQTGALGDGRPVPIELAARLEDLAADLRLQIGLAAIGAFDQPSGRISLDDLELTLAPADAESSRLLTVRAPRLEVDTVAEVLQLDPFEVDFAGMQLRGGLAAERIFGAPSFAGTVGSSEFSPADWMRNLGVEPPVTADPDVLRRAQFSAAVSGGLDAVTLSNLDLTLDQSRMQGELTVNLQRPAVRFDLALDEIDLDRYLEPAAKDAGDAGAEVALPRDELRGQDIQGRLTADRLRLVGVEFSNAEVGVLVRDGRLRLHPLTGEFYGGRYSGDVRLDGSAEVPALTLDDRIDSVAFQRLVADLVESEALSGTALGFARVTGSGRTSDELLANLQGELGLTLTEGALEGINVWYEIRRGMALYKGLPPPEPEPDRTVFSRMQLAAGVDGGLLRTRELVGELPFLTLRGDGTLDLLQSRADLGLVAAVRRMPELANDPLASELAGRSLPFRIRGPLDDLSISIDWKEFMKSEAADRLIDKLGLGPKDAAEGEDGPEDASAEDQLKEKATQSILDLLRGNDKDGDKDQDGG